MDHPKEWKGRHDVHRVHQEPEPDEHNNQPGHFPTGVPTANLAHQELLPPFALSGTLPHPMIVKTPNQISRIGQSRLGTPILTMPRVLPRNRTPVPIQNAALTQADGPR